MTWPGAGTSFWIAVILFDLYAIARAVTRGHGVESTLAWIFAILALPGVGAGFYVLLANPSIRRTTRRKRLSAAAIRQAVSAQLRKGGPAEMQLFSGEGRSILHLSMRLTGIPPSSSNQVQLLTKTGHAFRNIEQAIAQARRSIWTECYIIRNDETGYLFLDLLADRARKGIEVRLLYDAFGSLGLDGGRLKAIVDAGGRVEAFSRLNPLRRNWAIHLRNHRKVIVVDGEVGFTGGMNLSDEYSGSARRRGGQFFRDTHLEMKGPAVADLAQIFAEDWSFATGEELKVPPRPPPIAGATSLVSVLPSGPDQEHNASALVYFAGITSARERCYLTSPYFIPDQSMTQALVSAALRGVDVRILVPGRNDVALVGVAARSYYPRLIRAGVRMYEYQPSMLHAKSMVVDGSWGVVGSANVDIRSFRLNFEVGALIHDLVFMAQLENRFHADLLESSEVTAHTLSRRGRFMRLWEGTARLLSPIL